MNDDLKQRAHEELTALADLHGGNEAERIEQQYAPPRYGHGIKGTWLRFSRNRLAVVGWIVLGFMVLMAMLAPELADDDALKVTFQVAGPSADHWLGTDRLGRDMWTVLWLGARTSLAVAFMVAVIIFAVGSFYGALSGFIGGRTDNIMMRFLDSLYGLPYLPIAIIMVVYIREVFPDVAPLVYVVIALSVTSWFTAARLMRAEVLRLKLEEYIESARGSGATTNRIIFRHLMPNAMGVLVVAAFLEIPGAILGEAALSFLGLGIPVGEPSWGALANDGFKSFSAFPHLIVMPGIFIAAAVLSAVVLADGIRDVLDPRSNQQ